jgi:hypothetical protein
MKTGRAFSRTELETYEYYHPARIPAKTQYFISEIFDELSTENRG